MKWLSSALIVIACLSSCRENPRPAEPVHTGAAPTEVARVVFVGKQKACACTEERMRLTWTALEEALGKPPRIPVERIDIESDAAEQFQEMQALMVIPGLYFLDETGALIGMLQGELTAKEIADLLG